MKRNVLLTFAALLLPTMSGVMVLAQETDASRAPTGAITNPGDLLKESDGTEFRFSYFPSLNRLRLLVLRSPQQSTQWECVLRAAGNREALKKYAGKLPMPAAGATLETPALIDGMYELTFTLVSSDGKRGDIRRTFERKHFPWENTALGRDRVVIPPFTPLAVDEASGTVGCVLRKYELDGVGLWKQVSSQDRPLLNAPMRLEIESGGKTNVAKGPGVTFSEKAADRVRGGSSLWNAGPVQGSTEFDFGYDGLMEITLHLQPTTNCIDAMQLVIPMKANETWLMHPVTDLLRFHYAGRIPNGKGNIWDYDGKMSEVRYTDSGEPDTNGNVWDSRRVGRHQLPGPFVPYIWLGGPERGICWFAENDRDWNLAADKPALEIRKRDGTTSLVVHFINQPTILTRAHTIRFALMATPAKPMPEAPVSFRRWWAGGFHSQPKPANTVAFGFMGSCFYWGTSGPYAAFWPAHKNFSIYDEFARLRSGGVIDQTFVDKWLSQFTPDELRLAQAGTPDWAWKPSVATWRSHVNWSLNLLNGGRWPAVPGTGQTAFIIPYTNARGGASGDEIRSYMDEWSTIDIADPRWPGEERFLREKQGGYQLATYGRKLVQPCEAVGVAYAVDPVPSDQDMILYYVKRMLETFAEGIYFDDYFLSPNYNPLGPGYVDDEGKLHAGVNIFAFHDLTKRVAVMQHQMGMRPLVYLHMSNANIVPLLSFGTMILDHEWRDHGDWTNKDSQKRLYLDDDTSLLLAQSTGLQSGCLAVYHDLFLGDERLSRSALGVSLTHEIKFGRSDWASGDRVRTSMSEFGYGLPDCRVWRYWDDDQPLTITGAPAKTLVLARDGEALLVVCSYGPGGDVTLRLDKAKLGLTADVTAVNAESGETIERLAPGCFRLPLPMHDFRLIHIRKR
ncbi:MAG: DUF6067 family protein [Kiritimatiellaeota bacterium]|nr:DUF6067 family protein [Kiritimatiellota bacterium]